MTKKGPNYGYRPEVRRTGAKQGCFCQDIIRRVNTTPESDHRGSYSTYQPIDQTSQTTKLRWEGGQTKTFPRKKGKKGKHTSLCECTAEWVHMLSSLPLGNLVLTNMPWLVDGITGVGFRDTLRQTDTFILGVSAMCNGGGGCLHDGLAAVLPAPVFSGPI